MTSNDIKTTAEDLADEASSASRAALSDVTSKTSDLSEAASDAASRVRARLKDVADRVPSSASDTLDIATGGYKTASDQVLRQIGRQPIEALLLAGAIGYLVGWATNRN